MADFTVDLKDIELVGDGFSRAECILYTESGDMFASHLGAAVRHIAPDGRSKILGEAPESAEFVPNGIALQPGGTLLIANMGEDGGVWELDLTGTMRPYLTEVDGVELQAANFVGRDHQNRIWIGMSTRTQPRFKAYNDAIADGFVVLVDESGARIVADGIAFTNECRVNDAGDALFVSETSGRRIRRFTIRPDGTLDDGEVFTEFGAGTFPDGIDFDEDGYLWVTSIVSNRVFRVRPDGSQSLVLEDNEPDHIAWVEAARQSGTMAREHFYTVSSQVLRPVTSVCFADSDRKSVYLGSLDGKKLAKFRSPVAGRKPPHWDVRRPF
jgi:sugar lactone lactonase YvrE